MSNLTVTVSGFEAEQVERWLVERLADRADEMMGKAVEEHAREAVTKAAKGATEERIRTEINRLIDEGWPETDCYGNSASGKRATLRQRIEKSLHATELSRIASDAIRQALNSSLGKDIEAAKAQIGQFIDAQVAGTLQAALKQALGLK